MPSGFKALLWAVVLVDAYVLVYYRLMVKYHYERAQGVREGTFWTLLSFPPYARLPDAGRKYARRYWIAFALLVGCVTALALGADFSRLGA